MPFGPIHTVDPAGGATTFPVVKVELIVKFPVPVKLKIPVPILHTLFNTQLSFRLIAQLALVPGQSQLVITGGGV